METKTERIANKELVERLAILWDGRASYVMDGAKQYRVVIFEGEPMFLTDKDDTEAQ
jgi:hypothetical protein